MARTKQRHVSVKNVPSSPNCFDNTLLFSERELKNLLSFFLYLSLSLLLLLFLLLLCFSSSFYLSTNLTICVFFFLSFQSFFCWFFFCSFYRFLLVFFSSIYPFYFVSVRKTENSRQNDFLGCKLKLQQQKFEQCQLTNERTID